MGSRPVQVEPGRQFPEATLPGIPGDVTIADPRASAPRLVLFERGHWCVSCRRHLGQIAAAIDSFNHRALAIVAIVHEPLADLREAAKWSVYPFPIGVDPNLEVSESLGLAGTDEFGKRTIRPAAIVIRPGGEIAFSYVGDDSLDRLSVPALLLAIDRLT